MGRLYPLKLLGDLNQYVPYLREITNRTLPLQVASLRGDGKPHSHPLVQSYTQQLPPSFCHNDHIS